MASTGVVVTGLFVPESDISAKAKPPSGMNKPTAAYGVGLLWMCACTLSLHTVNATYNGIIITATHALQMKAQLHTYQCSLVMRAQIVSSFKA